MGDSYELYWVFLVVSYENTFFGLPVDCREILFALSTDYIGIPSCWFSFRLYNIGKALSFTWSQLGQYFPKP